MAAREAKAAMEDEAALAAWELPTDKTEGTARMDKMVSPVPLAWRINNRSLRSGGDTIHGRHPRAQVVWTETNL
jgi:hypothetical protein